MSYQGRKLSRVLQEVQLSGIKLTIYDIKINRREKKKENSCTLLIEYSQQLMVKLVFILVSCLLIFIKNACHTLVRFKTFLCACCSFYFYLKL